MNKKRTWAIAIVVTATAGVFALQNVSAPSSTNAITITSTETPIAITSTPTYEGCGFMWAYHEDPRLSSKIDGIIHKLNPTASANVQLYGEDCVYADGHSTFGAMETDFYIQLPVDDLSADEKFGNWITQVMAKITALPEDEVQGSKGFVEFSLTKSDTERIVFRVQVSDYLKLDPGVTGAMLFNRFYTPPSPSNTSIPSTPNP